MILSISFSFRTVEAIWFAAPTLPPKLRSAQTNQAYLSAAA
jgi:hypothetical protein